MYGNGYNVSSVFVLYCRTLPGSMNTKLLTKATLANQDEYQGRKRKGNFCFFTFLIFKVLTKAFIIIITFKRHEKRPSYIFIFIYNLTNMLDKLLDYSANNCGPDHSHQSRKQKVTHSITQKNWTFISSFPLLFPFLLFLFFLSFT